MVAVSDAVALHRGEAEQSDDITVLALEYTGVEHPRFAMSVPAVLEAIPDAVLLMVGGGPLEADLRSLAQELGIQAACRFAGHTDGVQPFMAATDLVVIPSWFEGFCFGAVEAQALEKPVVASRASSVGSHSVIRAP